MGCTVVEVVLGFVGGWLEVEQDEWWDTMGAFDGADEVGLDVVVAGGVAVGIVMDGEDN